jgi:predicted anti-sigma-YlaC factor YlaD
MHQPIRDGLEDYLAGREHPRFTAHLAACSDCRENVNRIIRQNQLLRLLRVESADVAPSPGFYARVIDRIDARAPNGLLPRRTKQTGAATSAVTL